MRRLGRLRRLVVSLRRLRRKLLGVDVAWLGCGLLTEPRYWQAAGPRRNQPRGVANFIEKR